MAPPWGRPDTEGMRVVTASLISVLTSVTTAAMLLVAGPASAAEGDLAGRWVSDSLRDNRIGYFLVLREDSGRTSGYVGQLRFERQDGSREERIPVRVTVAGDQVVITVREGTFDRAGRTMRARLVGSGTLVLTGCLDRLRQVMSWDLASDCTLRIQR